MPAPIKIKIALEHAPVSVNRTLLVPNDINMRQMHLVIQECMEWMCEHLFQFSDSLRQPQLFVTSPDEIDDYFASDEIQIKPANEITLKNFFNFTGGKPIYYEYDFGSGWLVKITLLKPTQKQSKDFTGIPVCIKATGAPVLEDIGGSPGYSRFLQIIKNPKHPEYKEMVEWSGINPKTFNLEAADIGIINSDLEFIYEYTEWNDPNAYGGYY